MHGKAGDHPRRLRRVVDAKAAQQAAHQMRHAAPDKTARLGKGQRRQTFLGQHGNGGGVDVGRAVDQRAVVIEENDHSADSAAARMAAILAP